MPSYRVIWEIDVDADDPREAAEQAAQAMHPVTLATVFMVIAGDGKGQDQGRHYQVDLRSGTVENCQHFDGENCS